MIKPDKVLSLEKKKEILNKLTPEQKRRISEKQRQTDEIRGRIVGGAIIVEGYLNHIISDYYIKEHLVNNFTLDILNNQNFTFMLKRQIINKVMKSINIDKIKEASIKKLLQKVNEIRNKAAHCQFVAKSSNLENVNIFTSGEEENLSNLLVQIIPIVNELCPLLLELQSLVINQKR